MVSFIKVMEFRQQKDFKKVKKESSGKFWYHSFFTGHDPTMEHLGAESFLERVPLDFFIYFM